jgi:hypothetical protein
MKIGEFLLGHWDHELIESIERAEERAVLDYCLRWGIKEPLGLGLNRFDIVQSTVRLDLGG